MESRKRRKKKEKKRGGLLTTDETLFFWSSFCRFFVVFFRCRVLLFIYDFFFVFASSLSFLNGHHTFSPAERDSLRAFYSWS